MQLILCLVFVPLVFVHGHNNASSLCETWNKVEEGLKKEFDVTCSKSTDCYAFNCSGHAYGNIIDSGIHLYPCEHPPSVEVYINVPKLDVKNFTKRIYHNDSVTLNKNLKVEFELEMKNKVLLLGIYAHFLNNGSFPLLRMRFPVIQPMEFPVNCPSSEEKVKQSLRVSTKKPVIVHKGISVISSSSADPLVSMKGHEDGYVNCSIVNSTCGEEEICKQIHKFKPDGICVCISNYTRDVSGKCVNSQPVDTSSVSLLLTAILVPIFVILILVGAVYASIRFKVCQRLRRRLRVQVYEHVLLGEEEDEDLTNPVA